MKISFVCVNYNNHVITTNYADNIMAMAGSDERLDKIIIVDNASDKEDYQALCRALETNGRVKIIRSESNKGYFGGLNLGIEYMKTHCDSDVVCIGNNDLIFERDFLESYFNENYDEQIFTVIPDVVTIGGKHQNPQYRDRLSRMRILGYDIYYQNYFFAILIETVMGFMKHRREKTTQDFKKSGKIFLCTGACMILQKRFLDICGQLSEEVFMWGEEAIFTGQIHQHGGTLYYDPQLRVTHMENATVNKISNYNKYKLVQASYRVYRKYIKGN